MAYVQFRFFGDYLEELSRALPVAGHLCHSTGRENTDVDTLRLPLQKPPTDQINNRPRF